MGLGPSPAGFAMTLGVGVTMEPSCKTPRCCRGGWRSRGCGKQPHIWCQACAGVVRNSTIVVRLKHLCGERVTSPTCYHSGKQPHPCDCPSLALSPPTVPALSLWVWREDSTPAGWGGQRQRCPEMPSIGYSFRPPVCQALCTVSVLLRACPLPCPGWVLGCRAVSGDPLNFINKTYLNTSSLC